jgi:rhodanese-related sulfurtransferase
MRRFLFISLIMAIAAVSASPLFAGGSREAGALIGPEEAFDMVQSGEAILVDVRDEAAYLEAHLAGAISIPLAQVASSVGQLERREQTVITYCSCPAEETSSAAASELIAQGFTDVLVLDGGVRTWALMGLPLRAGARP